VGKGCRCLGPTTFPPLVAECLEIWEPQPPGTLRFVQACNGIALPFISLIIMGNVSIFTLDNAG
jgi:hypothetical protein